MSNHSIFEISCNFILIFNNIFLIAEKDDLTNFL